MKDRTTIPADRFDRKESPGHREEHSEAAIYRMMTIAGMSLLGA